MQVLAIDGVPARRHKAAEFGAIAADVVGGSGWLEWTGLVC